MAEKLLKEMESSAEKIGDYNLIVKKVDAQNPDMLKDMAFRFKNKGNYIVALAAEIKGKPSMVIMIPEPLIKEKDLNAGALIREAAKEFKGGGGGQAFFATAGGKDPGGIDKALSVVKKSVLDKF